MQNKQKAEKHIRIFYENAGKISVSLWMFRDVFYHVQNSDSNEDFGTTKAAKMYFSMSDPGPNAFATGDTKPVSFE